MARATHYVALLAACLAAWGQAPPDAGDRGYRPVSLTEAAERTAPDFRPKRLGDLVRVSGIASAAMVEAPDATYLGLTNGPSAESGLMLIFSGDNKPIAPAAAAVRPGSRIEAEGVVSLHAGQAVLKPHKITINGSVQPVSPPNLHPPEAASFRYEGMQVVVEGTIAEYREASSGDLLEFVEGGQLLKVFLPLMRHEMDRPLARFHRGDRVRVRGLVSQFCTNPPYDRFFQLLLANSREIDLIEGRPLVPPQVAPAIVFTILLGILATWYLQQRSSRQNQVVQRILESSESLYGVSSSRELAEAIRKSLLDLIPAQSVEVYHYDPSRKLLERIPDNLSSVPHSFHIEECRSGRERALSLAIRNKVMMQFADKRSAEVLEARSENSEAILVIPMKGPEEACGALLITGKPGPTLLSDGLRPAMQHLANDAGQYLIEIEQGAIREQIHRSEKLAVAGQLIQGVTTELNAPLEKIREFSLRLNPEDAEAIGAQVFKASETVRRIVSVARAEQIDARPVELRHLFQKLFEKLEEEGHLSHLETELNLPQDAMLVLGSQAQLAQVFENLLEHSRSAGLASIEHFLAVTLNRVGRSVMIEIEFSGPFTEGEGPDFNSTALGLAICRGLLQSHGGDLRFSALRPGRYRYEAELPSLSSSPVDDFGGGLEVTGPRGQLTALLVEPERQTQRRMLALFGEMNHRLVPVTNIEDAADLADRMRFDVVFASSRPEGGTWTELFHRLHHRTPHFVVLSEASQEQGSDLIDGSSAVMMKKPVEADELRDLIGRFHPASLSAARSVE